MDRSFFLRNLWRWAAGVPELDALVQQIDLVSLKKTEWSPEFERLMRNRLLLGAMRYGKLGAPNKPHWDRPSSIERRMAAYRLTGNDELLVDIANLCMLEFVEGAHPSKHFAAVDDDGEHVRAS